MKKMLFLIAFTLFFIGITFSQPAQIEKGNLISIHLLKYENLNPGVSIEQLEDFYYNHWIPAWSQYWPEAVFIPLKGIRGEYPDRVGMFCVIKSEEERDKYFAREGGMTKEGEKLFENLQPVFSELRNLVEWSDLSTDWLVL